MRFAATVFGVGGTLCLYVFWLLLFWMSSPSFLVLFQWLYIASLFFFGILGAHLFYKKVWYTHCSAFLFVYLSLSVRQGVWLEKSYLLHALILEDSVLFVSCMLFGSILYFILFQKSV